MWIQTPFQHLVMITTLSNFCFWYVMVMEGSSLGTFKLYCVTDWASAFFYGWIRSVMLHIQLAHFLDNRSYHYRVNGRIVVQKLPYEVSYQDVGTVGVLWRHFHLTASAILGSAKCSLGEGEGMGERMPVKLARAWPSRRSCAVLSFSVVSGVFR